jgi:hypothetical protein
MARDPEKKKASDKRYRERNREKRAASNKRWRELNPEKSAALKKAWAERHREEIAAQKKLYRQSNSQKISQYGKKFRELHREEIAARKKVYRKLNRERLGEYAKKFNKRKPELKSERSRKRRAKQRNSVIPLTANERQSMLVMERTRQELQTETGRVYHIDHILPISHGGIHHPINLRILDGGENTSKWNKILPEGIALAPEHFRLYSERVSPERAWEFVRQLAAGLGLSEEDLDALITGKPLKSKPTLEDFML